jgi:aspartate/methionine/tyrosine aminotransferase
LQLAISVLINPGESMLMADPGYPCNRHFTRLVEGKALAVPVTADTNYQLTADLIKQHWNSSTVAALVASPSNPTGTIVNKTDLQAIINCVHERKGRLIVDEIYHGLIYEGETTSALALSDDVFVVNSFSKYFGMTGWRVGWLVVPEPYINEVDKLAQNIFLAASTPAQYAALSAFQPEAIAILEKRRQEFQQRRDYLLPALREIGFDIPVTPQGAFYLYAGCSQFTDDSFQFAMDVLEKAGVAITPGKDFGTNQPEKYVRFAYTTDIDKLKEGVARLRKFLNLYP